MYETNSLSASLQDCLEALLEVENSENRIRITDVANKLNIAKASVKQSIDKLKELGMVNQQAYGPIVLTEKGRELAERISLRHKKLFRFLVEVLGVDADIAEKDACLMEHAVSSQTMQRLTDFLYKSGYMTDNSPSKK
jgi:DtxR family Mn-dependent transcriptional regulator